LFQVFVTDLWTDHTPWPFNQLPRSYSFLVKHGSLWKITYYGTAPRVVHQPHFAATATFIARLVIYHQMFLLYIIKGSPWLSRNLRGLLGPYICNATWGTLFELHLWNPSVIHQYASFVQLAALSNCYIISLKKNYKIYFSSFIPCLLL
jgi:hypothetical protein